MKILLSKLTLDNYRREKKETCLPKQDSNIEKKLYKMMRKFPCLKEYTHQHMALWHADLAMREERNTVIFGRSELSKPKRLEQANATVMIQCS